MKSFISKLTKRTHHDYDDADAGDQYLEINTDTGGDKQGKIMIRPFVINDFSDIKPILDTLREGYTIALVNIRPLKDKDLVELKRAINKIKKTTEAIEGDIAGFGDDYIVIAPHFAEIYRGPGTVKVEEE
ncbi:MAG: cell division protein SepF [Nanoarchaeota archaeon]